jgi:hypothetical protein
MMRHLVGEAPEGAGWEDDEDEAPRPGDGLLLLAILAANGAVWWVLYRAAALAWQALRGWIG